MKKPNLKTKAEKHSPSKYLASVDPVLAKVIAKIELAPAKAHGGKNHFHSLVEAIVSQQLSVKASDTIFGRFRKLFPGLAFPKPEAILKIPHAKLRSAGLSDAKAKYIKDLAQKVHAKEVMLHKLEKMSNEEVVEHLVKVKGIGRWTAEMFLMFSLQRPDVFSHGDLGLRNAIIKLYGFKKPPTEKQIEKIVSKWSPHKTTASRYLWKSLNNESIK